MGGDIHWIRVKVHKWAREWWLETKERRVSRRGQRQNGWKIVLIKIRFYMCDRETKKCWWGREDQKEVGKSVSIWNYNQRSNICFRIYELWHTHTHLSIFQTIGFSCFKMVLRLAMILKIKNRYIIRYINKIGHYIHGCMISGLGWNCLE